LNKKSKYNRFTGIVADSFKKTIAVEVAHRNAFFTDINTAATYVVDF